MSNQINSETIPKLFKLVSAVCTNLASVLAETFSSYHYLYIQYDVEIEVPFIRYLDLGTVKYFFEFLALMKTSL